MRNAQMHAKRPRPVAESARANPAVIDKKEQRRDAVRMGFRAMAANRMRRGGAMRKGAY